MRPRLYVLIALFAILCLFYLLRPRAELEVRDQPLPELPIATLEGRSLGAAELAGEPWLINLWMPG